MLCDWFYAIEVYDDSGKVIEVLEIERRIRQVVTDAERRMLNGETAVSVGVLSADNRDTWAAVSRIALTIFYVSIEIYRTALTFWICRTSIDLL